MDAWIGNYIGLPFKDRGRDEEGYDCWGLLRLIYGEVFGVELPTYIDRYKDTKDSESLGPLIRQERENWESIEEGNEKLGDVVVIRIRGQPMHTGLVLGEKKFLHIEDGVDSSIEAYDSIKWTKRVIGFYRHWSNKTI